MNPPGDAPVRVHGDKEIARRKSRQKVLRKFQIIEKQLRRIQQKKG
jgi:hypothetical protein